MAHPLNRVFGSVVIDKLKADHQRVSLSKIYIGLAQDLAFFAQLRDFLLELEDPIGIIRRLGFIASKMDAGLPADDEKGSWLTQTITLSSWT